MNASIYLMRSVFFSLLVAPSDLPESISMFYCSNAHQVHICVCVCLLPFPATQNCSHSDGLGLPYTGFPQAAPWICTPAEQSIFIVVTASTISIYHTSSIFILNFLFMRYLCASQSCWFEVWEWRGWSCWDHSPATKALLLPALFPPVYSAWKYLFLVYLTCKVPI